MERRVRAGLSAHEGRRFGLTVGTAFLVLAAVTWWRGHMTVTWAFVGLGGLLIAGGLIVPGLMGPVHRAWMGMAHAISKVTTPIFMGIVYFLVLMPVGLVMRGLGRDPLSHPEDDGGYWATRDGGTPEARTMERQF